jgi:hypothetical protein
MRFKSDQNYRSSITKGFNVRKKCISTALFGALNYLKGAESPELPVCFSDLVHFSTQLQIQFCIFFPGKVVDCEI